MGVVITANDKAKINLNPKHRICLIQINVVLDFTSKVSKLTFSIIEAIEFYSK